MLCLIQMGDLPFVHVGEANNLERHQAQLQNGCPLPLQLRHRARGGEKFVREVRDALRPWRTPGGWYRLEHETKQLLAAKLGVELQATILPNQIDALATRDDNLRTSLIQVHKPLLDDEHPWCLVNGDGIEGLLSYGPVDHVFTDTPYEISVDEKNARERVRKPSKFGFMPMDDALRRNAARAIAMQCRRWALIFCSDRETYQWCCALEDAGMVIFRIGHWVRLGTKPKMQGDGPAQGSEPIIIAHAKYLTRRWNGGGKPAVWYAPIVKGQEREHETQKPASLAKQLIEDFTDEGETVADIFAGNGTFGAAAIGLSRRFVGWELGEEEHAKAMRRLSSPLFEVRRSAEQGEMFEAKGAAARARMELERKLHELVIAKADGIGIAEFSEHVDADPRNVARALKRLCQANKIRREGRTKDTRYFAVGEQDAQGATENHARQRDS
jgi:hypothetical protein